MKDRLLVGIVLALATALIAHRFLHKRVEPPFNAGVMGDRERVVDPAGANATPLSATIDTGPRSTSVTPRDPVARVRAVVSPVSVKPAAEAKAAIAADAVHSDTITAALEPAPLISPALARLALGLVGTDPEAEYVWYLAINDPALSDDDRRNLIEDLNEDGFPDPKNLTPDDLPLILNRLELIEHLAPYAMDDVNAAAFEEAYKDLTKMADKLNAP